MPASVNDKFRKASSGTRPENAYLTASKSVGASTATVSTTTGWATDTGTDFVLFLKDATGATVAGTLTTWKGTVSGTTISNLTLIAGTEPVGGYPSGENSVVIATPTAAQNDSLIDGILVHADQDGTLKAGAVDATAVLADAIVTNAKLSTTAGQPGGAWTTWTPTLTNLTIGNGTVVARYMQVGKTVHGYLTVLFGSTTVMGSDPTFTAPVSINSNISTVSFNGIALDAGNNRYDLFVVPVSSSAMGWFAKNGSGTYISQAAVSSTAPFVWGTGDYISANFTYEAA